MLDRLLVATDGSDSARRAVDVAASIASAADASLDLVHVTSADGPDRPDEDAVLAAVSDLVDASDASVTPHVLEGEPADRIAAFAAERDADLLVLGRHGLSGVRERLLGNVTNRVLRSSERPVLAVPASDEPFEVSDVLVPTDGSEAAAWAVPVGAALARRLDARVHVCHVVDLQTVAGPFSAGGVTDEEVERFEERGREAIDRIAGLIRDEAPECSVTTAVVRDTPEDGIRTYVEDRGIDLVAMSSRGESSAVARVLGSVADRVLRTVDVPVLVTTSGEA